MYKVWVTIIKFKIAPNTFLILNNRRLEPGLPVPKLYYIVITVMTYPFELHAPIHGLEDCLKTYQTEQGNGFFSLFSLSNWFENIGETLTLHYQNIIENSCIVSHTSLSIKKSISSDFINTHSKKLSLMLVVGELSGAVIHQTYTNANHHRCWVWVSLGSESDVCC